MSGGIVEDERSSDPGTVLEYEGFQPYFRHSINTVGHQDVYVQWSQRKDCFIDC